MSDAQHSEYEENHEGPIRTPKQLIGAVVASFVVPVVVIIMLANFVDFGGKSGAGSDSMSAEAVARRIQPGLFYRLVYLGMFLGGPQKPDVPRELAVGMPADLCVLSVPPAEVLAALDASLVAATVYDGAVVHEKR